MSKGKMKRKKVARVRKKRSAVVAEKSILFIIKKGVVYGEHHQHHNPHWGLTNSVHYIVKLLVDLGYKVRLVEVDDNNDIDREVKAFNPTHVILEALWVVPEKFEVLHELYPDIKWIIRIHSNLPFLSQEGIAMDWIFRYVQNPNVSLASNSIDLYEALQAILPREKFSLLPNYYEVIERDHPLREGNVLNVGCFGAIRPLKNQLNQAVAAIRYCEENRMMLRFHINVPRLETGGEPILRNIRALFDFRGRYELVEHQWLPHKEFMELLASMDLGMQVSFSETFNLTTADMVAARLPIVVSSEVFWVTTMCHASTTRIEDIVRVMAKVLKMRRALETININNLKAYARDSQQKWVDYLENK